MTDKRKKAGGYVFGGLIAAVIIAGGFLVVKEINKPPMGSTTMPVDRDNKPKDPYAESSLKHIPESMISYQKVIQFKSNFRKSWGLAVNNAGQIYVCGDDGIRLFSKDGKELKHIKSDETVRYILLHENKIYACISNRVDILDLNGSKTGSWNNFENSAGLTAIGILGDHAYIADRNNKVVWKVDKSGNIISSFGSSKNDKKNGLIIPGPYMDIDISHDKLIFVSNPGRHNINGYNEDGELKVVTGHPSFKYDGFVGCCNPVAILCMGDDIASCEKGISRVKVIDRDDQFKTVIAAPKVYKKFKHSIIIDLAVDNKTGNVLTLVQGFEDVFIFEKTKGDKG